MGDLLGGPLDIDSIVSVLMQKQMTQLVRMKKLEKQEEIKLSLYGQLGNFVGNISTALQSINDAFNTSAFSTSVSNSSLVSATVTSNINVYAGTHQLNVTSIAQAQITGSVSQFSTRNQALNLDDTLTFTIGSNSFSVDINAENTLEDIRDAINQSNNNNGVTASIIASTDANGNQQYGLVLASKNTGTANAVSIAESTPSTFNFSKVITAAQDAIFTFDSSSIVSSKNTISDVLDGLSFTLLGTGESSITVSQSSTAENTGITNAINGFVDAYNKTMDFIDLSIANSEGGNNVLAMVKMNLKDMLQTQISGITGMATLNDIGIGLAPATTGLSNKLDKNNMPLSYVNGDDIMLHADTLSNVLTNNSVALQKFFTTVSTGFSSIATTALTNITQSGGIIYVNKDWSLQAKNQLGNKIDNEEDRLEDIKKQLIGKYASLNSMIKSFENIGSMLESTFSHMSFKK